MSLATKTSGLYYALVILSGEFVWKALRNIKDRGAIFATAKQFAVLSAVLTVVVLVTCFRPYVTNLIDHGSVLYPPATVIMGGQVPENLRQSSPFVKFGYLLFSAGQNEEGKALALARFGFTTNDFLIYPWDARGAGFGPFFKFQFALSVILALSALKPALDNGRRTVLFSGLLCLLASVLFPESWWARYVPLTWGATVLFAAPVLPANDFPARWKRLAAGAFLLCCALNISLFAMVTAARSLRATSKIDALAESLTAEPGLVLDSDNGFFNNSLGYELKRRGINISDGSRCAGEPIGILYGGAFRVYRTCGEIQK